MCVCASVCMQVCSHIRFKLTQYIQMRLPVMLVQLKGSLRQAHNSVHLEVCVCVCPICVYVHISPRGPYTFNCLMTAGQRAPCPTLIVPLHDSTHVWLYVPGITYLMAPGEKAGGTGRSADKPRS